MARVCVVDDEELMRDSVATILKRQGHSVEAFDDPYDALEVARGGSFDLVVTDLKMPGMTGVDLLRGIRTAGCDTATILMTAFGTVNNAVEAMKMGAFDYIEKPFQAEQLCKMVERACQVRQLQSENETLRASLRDNEPPRELIGGSAAMRLVREQIARVAGSDATVLIQGESGTGKELVARAIHVASPRLARPMLCVNCAALSNTLLESELFGHEKGAFTGADRARKGRFELAEDASLLLDEISEIPLSLQAKLLRVLQEREFERVGSSVTRRTNTRVIATTNRDMMDWVSKNRFRQDLYYRLSVLPIVLPSLREHADDIEEMVEYFLDRRAQRTGSRVQGVTSDTIDLLKSYTWPGNVRELENLIERACVLCDDDQIHAEVLEPWLRSAAGGTAPLPASLRPGHLLADAERHLVERTLKQFEGHREKTARALGIGLRTLSLKLKRWRQEQAAAG
jgi:two-component system, NtrC family, response regulator HydG